MSRLPQFASTFSHNPAIWPALTLGITQVFTLVLLAGSGRVEAGRMAQLYPLKDYALQIIVRCTTFLVR
jgi:hypothetical protein